MKKILSCLLVAILVFSLSAAVFADNFVSSVANAGATELASVADKDGNDVASLIVVTPKDQEDRLTADKQAVLDAAYDSLSNAKDLSAVNAELKEAAADLNVAVSDLFDISATEEVSFPLTLTLKNKNLDNFVAMLQYVDGAWQWVDAEVNGDEITFTVDSLGVFAVVVSVEEAASPDTGDSVPYGMIIGAVVLVGAAAWFFAKSRKVKA